MSYDFSMQIDTGSGVLFPIEDGLNYTSNVCPIFRVAFSSSSGIRCLDELPGSSALPLISAAIDKMEEDRLSLELMNPANGWGDYVGALRILRELFVWCKKHPKAILFVSC